MSQAGRTFSESWHRVAGMRLGLRPTVTIRKQIFRGETWFLLHDPYNNSFFRVQPEVYQFVSRLRPTRTVEEVWEECLQKFPDTAPGQEDAIALLAQLHHTNLLYVRGATDSARVFDRYEKRRHQAFKSRLMSIMFPRAHLFDPDPLLNRLQPLLRVVYSWVGLLIWLAVVGTGIKLVVDNFAAFQQQAEGVLGPGNWLHMYVAIVVVKFLHEMGHAALCKRFGGEVHTMGVSFLLLTPLPYVDATSSWGFRSRVERALVGAGGMISELFIASLAAVVWSQTGQGAAHAMAYNIIWIASVSTVLFNVNPLVRFDGYYIMSDLLDLPNLQSRSHDQLVYLVEHHVFGTVSAQGPAASTKEALWLTVYGVLSGLYRILIFAGMALFVADKFLLLGLVMAISCVVTWFIVPLWSLGSYLASSPRLARNRLRAIIICAGCLGSMVGVLGLVPFPQRFRAAGVLEARHLYDVAAEAPGLIVKIVTPTGSHVTTGVPLIEMSNDELEMDIREAQAEVEEIEANKAKAKSKEAGELVPMEHRQAAIESRLRTLEGQRASLTLRARFSGTWVAPKLEEFVGGLLARGTVVGKIVDESSFRFTAVVLQEEASGLFLDRASLSEIRLRGLEGINVQVPGIELVPFQHGRLPSVALGWRGGGEIPVVSTDQTGLQTLEPFFLLRAPVPTIPGLVYRHGACGQMRLTLGYEPLLRQWLRSARQLVQRRYRT